MEPSKGRIVNYHCIEGEKYLGPGEDMILPAIITRVYENSPSKAINVIVFTNQPSSPLVMRTSISYGMTNGGGWSWPEIKTYNKDMGVTAINPDEIGEVKRLESLKPLTVPVPKVG